MQLYDATAANCRDIVVALQRAYMALAAGDQRVQVRFQDRIVEYAPGKTKELHDLIGAMRAQCPEAADLLNTSKAYRSARGRPARFSPA